MNPAHLHLMLNHVPIIGLIAGISVLALALFRHSAELQKAALGGLVVVGLLTIPVFLSGEPAEGVVEHRAGVADSAIEQHEDAAVVAFGAVAVTGLLAVLALTLAVLRKPIAPRVALLTLVIAGAAAGATGWAAHLGGRIVHGEISGDGASSEMEIEDRRD